MKKSPIVAALVAAALGLTACGGSTESATSEAGVTDMAWGMWIGSTADQEAWQQVADSVAAENPDIKLTIQGAPWADYWTKLSTQITSPDAPCVVSIQSLRASQFVEGLVPLDDMLDGSDVDLAAFDQGALNNLNINGEQYALPYDTGPVVLFYNADLFAQAGADEPKPGWSVDDFQAAAEELSAAGITAYAQSVEDIYLEGLAQGFNGSTPIADDGTVQANDPGFVEAMDWLGSLSTAGLASPADGADGTADDNAFMNGSAAMTIQGPWALLDFSSKVQFDMGVATVPAGDGGGDTISAGSGFGISKTCKTPEKAFQAIVSMTSPEVLTSLAEQGRAFPARTDSQSAWTEKAGAVAQVEEVMAHAQENSVPAPGSPQAEQMQQLFSQYLPQVVNGSKPAAEVLDNIQSQIS